MRIERIIFVILLLTADVGYCQKNQIQVLSNEKVLGKSLVDSIVFKGMEYVFPDRIQLDFWQFNWGDWVKTENGLTTAGKLSSSILKIKRFYGVRILYMKLIFYSSLIKQWFFL